MAETTTGRKRFEKLRSVLTMKRLLLLAVVVAAVCLLPLVFSAKSAFYGEPVADGLSAAITSLAFFGIYRKYLKGQGRLEAIRI